MLLFDRIVRLAATMGCRDKQHVRSVTLASMLAIKDSVNVCLAHLVSTARSMSLSREFL